MAGIGDGHNGGGPIWAIFDTDAVTRENWVPTPPNVDIGGGFFFSADTLADLARKIESISNRGLYGLLNFRLLFVLHSRMPANEGLPELVIEHLRSDLQKVVRAGLSPSHLLFLNHALAHHLINRGLREGR